jgi:signal transduction histidine kinase
MSQQAMTDSSPIAACPQCHAPVPPNETACPNCGVNLALAAALAERRTLAATPQAAERPPAAEVILPRFGEFLVKNGYISDYQLTDALIRQQTEAGSGRTLTVGQVLLEQGALTRDQLDEASIQQVKQLQTTLQEQNRQLEQRVTQRTQELQQAFDKLTELNRLKTNFVSNVTHELRTPLSQIVGYVGMISQGMFGPLNEEQKGALGVASQAAEQLGRLINNLIQFASSLDGHLLVNSTAFSIKDLGERLVVASRPKAEQNGVRLSADLPETLPLALADEEKVYWVLLELLDNAIKFSPDGDVTLKVFESNGRLIIVVRDSGIGIPPQRMTEIFEPFHQLDSSASRRFGGTGLGLTMVKQIVESHGSNIVVRSEPDKGSSFSFDLPVGMSL